jgi:hypothetical protein
VADVTGDGKADIVDFQNGHGTGGTSNVEIAVSSGAGLLAAQSWLSGFCDPGQTCAVADVNGDGTADAIAYDPSKNVWVALSSGTGFGGVNVWGSFLCTGSYSCSFADVTGDGRADLLQLTHSATVNMAPSAWPAPMFDAATFWDGEICASPQTCLIGDVNGDHLAERRAHLGGDRGACDARDIWARAGLAKSDERRHLDLESRRDDGRELDEFAMDVRYRLWVARRRHGHEGGGSRPGQFDSLVQFCERSTGGMGVRRNRQRQHDPCIHVDVQHRDRLRTLMATHRAGEPGRRDDWSRRSRAALVQFEFRTAEHMGARQWHHKRHDADPASPDVRGMRRQLGTRADLGFRQ